MTQDNEMGEVDYTGLVSLPLPLVDEIMAVLESKANEFYEAQQHGVGERWDWRNPWHTVEKFCAECHQPTTYHAGSCKVGLAERCLDAMLEIMRKH